MVRVDVTAGGLSGRNEEVSGRQDRMEAGTCSAWATVAGSGF
jgi:hypothetical protein